MVYNSSDYENYSAHRAYYQAVLSPEAAGPPIATYAHVVRDEDSQHITIQYWLFYYYNDWFNKHLMGGLGDGTGGAQFSSRACCTA